MKLLDALIATHKTRTHFDWLFLRKWDLTDKKEKKGLFLKFSLIFFSRLVMLIRFLKAYLEWLDPLSSMQKKLDIFFVPFWKKSTKTGRKKNRKKTFLSENSIFFKNSPSKQVLVFCVAISASRRFIWTIKQHYPIIFFIFPLVRGDPSDLGGSKRYAKGMDWSKTVFKVIFLDLIAFSIRIYVRAKTIPKFGF